MIWLEYLVWVTGYLMVAFILLVLIFLLIWGSLKIIANIKNMNYEYYIIAWSKKTSETPEDCIDKIISFCDRVSQYYYKDSDKQKQVYRVMKYIETQLVKNTVKELNSLKGESENLGGE